MKSINLIIILILMLSIFNFSSIELSQESSQTLLEQELEQNDPEKDKNDKFIVTIVSTPHSFSCTLVALLQLKCTTTYTYINTLFRPPIYS